MRIEPWGEDDLPLLEALLGDPAMMEHLGGPESPVKIRERQARYEPADSGMFKIVAGRRRGGRVGGLLAAQLARRRDQRDRVVRAPGVPAPRHRAHGHRPDDRAGAGRRADRRFLHAFPSVDNPPSNALCRALGFTLLGPAEVEYPPGSVLLVNDWRLDLSR